MQKLGLTKVLPYLFLMLINLIAPTLTVPNCTVIPVAEQASLNLTLPETPKTGFVVTRPI